MATNQEYSPLKALKQLIIAQKSAAMPDEPDDPAYLILHREMSAYDRYVSETVIRVLGGSMDAGAYPGTSALALAFEQIESLPGGNSTLTKQYRRYQQRLNNMLAAAIEASNSQ